MLKNTTNSDELSSQFDHFNLKKEYEIKWFDPNQLFMKHMTYVVYSVSFASTFLCIEENDRQNPQAFSIEKKQEDIENMSVGEMYNENSTLKKIIKEL
jgi:hypothetical protein